ncbi:Protein of unknown function [Bosea sp. CRIB-10]|uniref:DUF1190 domain-containing protein n=1 Tax=Bosea sp. CRIB-10 TaxID=378404 RepID=UPI0008EDE596|nr:DUF1190 domain-containing protein [Bosea sp. CRIB-10]SFD05569.1 Protein of unknown function [Bosea sp. CRIB-10]
MITLFPLVVARAAVFAVAGFALTPADLAAQVAGQTYVRRDECIEAGKLSAEQCENAYRNARAEFEQKAPRYASRSACERAHKRCGAQVSTTGGWDALARGGGGQSYVPRFVGIRVTGEGASGKTLPIIEGSAKVTFAARQVAALDDKVAARRAVMGGGGGQHSQQASGPYIRRGDRDDTVRVPMQEKKIGSDVAPGLYVDPDGVEWYKPAHRR